MSRATRSHSDWAIEGSSPSGLYVGVQSLQKEVIAEVQGLGRKDGNQAVAYWLPSLVISHCKMQAAALTTCP
jgi:hypothetical protein